MAEDHTHVTRIRLDWFPFCTFIFNRLDGCWLPLFYPTFPGRSRLFGYVVVAILIPGLRCRLLIVYHYLTTYLTLVVVPHTVGSVPVIVYIVTADLDWIGCWTTLLAVISGLQYIYS